MSESWFQVQLKIQSLIYFLRGAAAPAGKFNIFSDINILGSQIRPSFSEMGPNYTKFWEDIHPRRCCHSLC